MEEVWQVRRGYRDLSEDGNEYVWGDGSTRGATKWWWPKRMELGRCVEGPGRRAMMEIRMSGVSVQQL